MAKALVIVESPAKAKTINKYLGKNYIVKPINAATLKGKIEAVLPDMASE